MFKLIGGAIWAVGFLGNLLIVFRGYGEVSLLGVLISFGSTFLYGLLFWSIGIIFDELNRIRHLIYEVVYDMKKEITDSSVKEDTKAKMPTQSGVVRMTPINDNVWTCASCETINTSNTIICKVCGQYR